MLGKLANYVVRPKRTSYNPQKDLGPSIFYLEGAPCSRIDFRVTNNRNLTLQASIYHRGLEPFKETAKYACIIYCHGNCGNRTDSFESLKAMLLKDIFVVSFDFAGCGLSEGNYISLGLNESKDIECVIEYVRKEFKFVDPERIGLWGRSMGAVSAILYSSKRNDVSCVVLDSPFSDLSVLLEEYLKKYKLIAKVAGKYILRKMKEKIAKLAGFEVSELKPLEHIKDVRCPVLFVHSKKDKLIDIKHSKILFEKAEGEKHILEIEGGHNDKRPKHIYDEIKKFIVQNLEPAIMSQVNTKSFLYFSTKEKTKQKNLSVGNFSANYIPSQEIFQNKNPKTPQPSAETDSFSGYFIKDGALRGCHSSSGSPSVSTRNKTISSRKQEKNVTSLHELNLPASSRVDLKACSLNDETNLVASEAQIEFAEDSYKIKESERWKVLVQSVCSVEELGEPHCLTLQQCTRFADDSRDNCRKESIPSIFLDHIIEVQPQKTSDITLFGHLEEHDPNSVSEVLEIRRKTLQALPSPKKPERKVFPNYPKLFGKTTTTNSLTLNTLTSNATGSNKNA